MILLSGAPSYLTPVQFDLYVPNAQSIVAASTVRGPGSQSSGSKNKSDNELPPGRFGEQIDWFKQSTALKIKESALKREMAKRWDAGEELQDILNDKDIRQAQTAIIFEQAKLEAMKPLMASNLNRYNKQLEKFDSGEVNKNAPMDDGNGNLVYLDKENLTPLSVGQFVAKQFGDPLGTTFQGQSMPDFKNFETEYRAVMGNLGSSKETTKMAIAEIWRAMPGAGESIYDVLDRVVAEGKAQEVTRKDGSKGMEITPEKRNELQLLEAFTGFISQVKGDPKLSRVYNYYRSNFLLKNAKDPDKGVEERELYRNVLEGKGEVEDYAKVEKEFVAQFFAPRQKARLDTYFTQTQNYTNFGEIEDMQAVHNFTSAYALDPKNFTQSRPFNMIFQNVPIAGSENIIVNPKGRTYKDIDIKRWADNGEIPEDVLNQAMTPETKKRVDQIFGDYQAKEFQMKWAEIPSEYIAAENKRISDAYKDKVEYGSNETIGIIRDYFPNGVILSNGTKLTQAELLELKPVLVKRMNKNVILPKLQKDKSGQYTSFPEIETRLNDKGESEIVYSPYMTDGNKVKGKTPNYKTDIYYTYQLAFSGGEVEELKSLVDGKINRDEVYEPSSFKTHNYGNWGFSESTKDEIIEDFGAIKAEDTGVFYNSANHDFLIEVYREFRPSDIYEVTRKKSTINSYMEYMEEQLSAIEQRHPSSRKNDVRSNFVTK